MLVTALILFAPPAGLAAEAAAVKPLARTDLGRAFVAAADKLPAYIPRSVFRRKGEWRSAAEAAKLADRDGWAETPVDEATFHGLFYGTPLAYLLAVDRLAEAGGDLRGRRVLDFGHGGVGQLRLFAALGATAVGVDVDARQLAVYSQPTDQGPLGDAGGSVKLVHGRWPVEPKAKEAVGGGYDVIVSKNTLKNGYLHPAEPVDPRQRVDVGVDDPTFLTACHGALRPGGLVVIYNLSPAPAGKGQPYRPMADGRCPFSPEHLAAAGFETLVRDADESERARALGKALGWDGPPINQKLDTDLFALATVLRRK